MQNATVQTIKTVNLWCKNEAKNNDKLYRLEMTKANGKFDVFGVYGRRGGKLTLTILVEGVSVTVASNAFVRKYEAELRKGYKLIAEDVLEVGQSIPTVVENPTTLN